MSIVDVRPLPGIAFETAPPVSGRVLPRMDVVGFVGFASRGPIDLPVPVESSAEFERIFGGELELAWDAERSAMATGQLASSVRDFFANGGVRCWVVRVGGAGATPSRVPLRGMIAMSRNGGAPMPVAVLPAGSIGSWADDLEVGCAIADDPVTLSSGIGGSADWFVRSAQAMVPGDLLQVVLSSETVLVPIESVAQVRLGTDGRFEQTVRLRAAQACWLVPFPQGDLQLGQAMYADPTGTPGVAAADLEQPDQLDQPQLTLTLSGPGVRVPPVVGSTVRVDALVRDPNADPNADPLRLWLWLQVTSSSGVEPTGRDGAQSPTFQVHVSGVAAWQVSKPRALPRLDQDAPAVRLSLEITARQTKTVSVLDGLGFCPGHPRYVGSLPTDLQAFDAAGPNDRAVAPLWADSLAVRFPLAGLGEDEAVDLMPVQVGLLPDILAQSFVPAVPRLAREGLDAFDSSLFLDKRMVAYGVETILGRADDLLYRQERPVRLRGVHSLLSIDEVTVVAVPDATQRDWEPTRVMPTPDPPAAEPEPDDDVDCDHGDFVRCAILDRPPAPQWSEDGIVPAGSMLLRWDAVASATSYVVEESTSADTWVGAKAIDIRKSDKGNLPTETLVPAVSAVPRFYHVRAVSDSVAGPWSAGRSVPATPGLSFTVLTPAQYDSQSLLGVQTSVLRMCAARGDLFALLSVPEHYRGQLVIDHARAIRGQPSSRVSGAAARSILGSWETFVLGYGALFHPWLVHASGPLAAQISYSAPDGAVAGVVAKRARSRGAWVAPANETLRDVVALAQIERASSRQAFQDAQVNLVRHDPRGFLWLAEDTLATAHDERPMNVRRLISLVRRMALVEGTSYVFEPNDPVLRRGIERGFTEVMQYMHSLGAFAGSTAREAFQVNVGDPPNTRQSVDLGRLIVELKFAPSRALTFILVRLVRTVDQGFRLVDH